MNTIRTVALSLATLLLAVSALPAASLIFLVQTGKDSSGKPIFRQATSSDGAYLNSLNRAMGGSKAIANMLRFYDAIQKDRYAQTLALRGYSSNQIQQALARFKPDPVYMEVNGNSSGAYNDWKSSFTLQSGGRNYSVSSPRIVLPLNSQVARSGNWPLIEQTIVHEIGHGVQSKSYGADRLPTTPWLGKPHTGGSQTDQALALIEGYAAFTGAYFTGRLTIAEDKANTIATNYYSYDTNTGRIKPWSQLVATEGWVATTLYYISTYGQKQDAFWKMQRVMTYTAPRSTVELLANTMRYYPELTPLIQQVLYKTTGGQVGSASGSVARAPSAPGSTETSSGTSRMAAAPSNSSGGTSSDRLSTPDPSWGGGMPAGPGSDGLAQRVSDPYDRFYDAILDGGRTLDVRQEFQNLQAHQSGTIGQDGASLVRIQRGARILTSLYAWQAQSLAALPPHDPRRAPFQQGLAMTANLLSQQADLMQGDTASASGDSPGLPAMAARTYEVSTPAAPSDVAGPADSGNEEYERMRDSLSSGDSEAAKTMLEKYGEIFKRRQVQRRAAP